MKTAGSVVCTGVFVAQNLLQPFCHLYLLLKDGGKRKEKAHGLEKKKRNCPVWRRPESAHRESQGIYKQSPRSNACLEGHRILDKDDCISTDKHEHMDTN